MHAPELYPLEIEDVTKRCGHEVVVDDLTFTVATEALATPQQAGTSVRPPTGAAECTGATSSSQGRPRDRFLFPKLERRRSTHEGH